MKFYKGTAVPRNRIVYPRKGNVRITGPSEMGFLRSVEGYTRHQRKRSGDTRRKLEAQPTTETAVSYKGR